MEYEKKDVGQKKEYPARQERIPDRLRTVRDEPRERAEDEERRHLPGDSLAQIEQSEEKRSLDEDCPQPEPPQPGELHQPAEKYLIEQYRERHEHQFIEHKPDETRLHQNRENVLRTEFRKHEGKTDDSRACEHDGDDAGEDARGNISFLPTDIFQGLLEYYFTIKDGNYQEENDTDDEGLECWRELVALGKKPEESQREEHQESRHDKTLIFCKYF